MTIDADSGVRLLLAILATWRVTHLITREDGPGEVMFRIRRWMGPGFWGQLTDCFMCLSLWVAAPMAFFIAGRPADWVLSWLAVSGGACLIERWSAPVPAAPPIIIERFTGAEDSHGVLRTEPGGPEAGGGSSADLESAS